MHTPHIDMHCHSTNSDGLQSPEELYRVARERDIDLFAITEHDRVTRDAHHPPWVQDDGRIILHGAEVSVRYEQWEFSRSLHIPIYSLQFSSAVDDLLAGIRRGKWEKVLRQCEQLKENGCMIRSTSGVLVPFSLAAMQERFPDTREDGFNNGHLVQLVREHRDNMRKLELIAPGITDDTLMADGFKSGGKHTKAISLRNRPPEYEPSIEELIWVLDTSSTVISLAHPNYTFRSIDEFHAHIGHIISRGVNAIEMNSTASLDWMEAIRDFRDWQAESYTTPAMITHGSDCHDIYQWIDDRRHSTLGYMNRYTKSYELQESYNKILSHVWIIQ